MKTFILTGIVAAGVCAASVATAQQAGFGSNADQQFGNNIWSALIEQRLVGSESLMAKPYEGTDPHGSVLVTLEGELTVDGQSGTVIVKRNYGGNGASMDAVSNDPDRYLMAITVMFKRAGFDAANQDWFWAKYMPDGSYDRANDTPMVGAVQGCIMCHGDAPGDDMVYLNDRHQ